MSGFGPETLRRIADAMEDTRRMENVEKCIRVPHLDQHMLLAMNRTRKKELEFEFPDAGTITEYLKNVLIGVSTSDGQSAALGIFYTNRCCVNRRMWQFAVGIFPLYSDITEYHLRPGVSLDILKSVGIITITDRSATGSDPFLLDNHRGLDFIFFKKNPFTESRPYPSLIPIPRGSYRKPMLHEQALEENVIERALCIALERDTKPHIFREPGFDTFIKANRSDPKYNKLYRAWRFKYSNTGSDFAY